MALKHYGVSTDDLRLDVTGITSDVERRKIADFAQGFLGGTASDDFVRCDDAPPVWPKPPKPADPPRKPSPPVRGR